MLLVLGFAITFQGGADGLSLEPFAPSTVTADNLGVGLMFCFLLFIGFEATAIYGEEARDPRRTIPRAAMFAVLLIAAFYIFVSWALTMAYGVDDVAGIAINDLGNFVFNAAREYVGQGLVTTMEILFLVSTLATVQGFHNAIARYSFSLSRDGWVPAALGAHAPGPRLSAHRQLPSDRHRRRRRSRLLHRRQGPVPGDVRLADRARRPRADAADGRDVGRRVRVLPPAPARDRRVDDDHRAHARGGGLLTAVVLLVANWDVQTGATGGIIAYLPLFLLCRS